MTMDQDAARSFMERYQQTFETFDATAIAALFVFPCHVTGTGSEISVSSYSGADEWTAALDRVVGAYRTIGVERAELVSLKTTELSHDLFVAVVTWRLIGAGDRVLYEFDAAYTLADTGDGLRIAAIAHNETPRLMALMGRD